MKKRVFIKTCLRYPGGKSKALEFLIPKVPSYTEYREPFLGGASVFLRLAQLNPNADYWINDLQYATYAFWNTLYNKPKEMMQYILKQKNKYKNEMEGRELHKWCRSEINHVDGKDEFLTACYYYILNKTSFSGLTRIGSYAPQAFNSNFTDNCIFNLPKVSDVMHTVKSLKITNLDYSELLRDGNEDTFLSLDPPYDIKDNLYGNNGDMHRNFDHEKFANDIKQVKLSKWMITYNNNQILIDRFKDYPQILWDLQYTMKSKIRNNENNKSCKLGKELLILNYEQKEISLLRGNNNLSHAANALVL